MRTRWVVLCVLAGCRPAEHRDIDTARGQAYLRTQQYDDTPLDLAHYQPLILPGFKASDDEPIAPALSLEKAKLFLDTVALTWTRQNKCGTCHTNLAYLAARPLLGSMAERPAMEVREGLFRYLDSIAERPAREAPETPRNPLFIRLPIASMLAVSDGISGIADRRTLAEFDRVWRMQRPDGSFYWPTVGGMLPFLERDVDYVATLVALGVGYLPESYRATPAASAGLAKTVMYLRGQPANDLHAEVVLLWASTRTPGLLDEPRKTRILDRMQALQRADGGWSLPSLGAWKRHDGPPNDPIAGPSDGYATGLVTFVLCQAGLPRTHPSVARGLSWLAANQRVSGRWFTRSLYSDQFQHYLSNMGTAYAVMALRACDGARASS